MNAVAEKSKIKRTEGFAFPEITVIRSTDDHRFVFASRGKAKLYIRENRLHHEAIKIADKFVEGWVVGNVTADAIRILLADGYHEFKIESEDAA